MGNARTVGLSSHQQYQLGWTLLALGVILYIFYGGIHSGEYTEVDSVAIAPIHVPYHDPIALPDPVPIPQPPPVPALVDPITEPPPATATTADPDEFSVDAHGFWQGLGSTKGHAFDPKLATSISTFLKSEGAKTVLELGAGMGLYAKQLKKDGFLISCYDGNPDTQSLSSGRCGMVDLSQVLDFSPHDWVLSLEVGEHIPMEFERNFLGNLDNGARVGLILSWAIEGQGGTSHVNNRNNSYIKEKMDQLGFEDNLLGQEQLRNDASLGWFKNTLMVFKRK